MSHWKKGPPPSPPLYKIEGRKGRDPLWIDVANLAKEEEDSLLPPF